MNVLVIQPGFPVEISNFVRGLARRGATVLGVGDQPRGALTDAAKEGLAAYLQVGNLWDDAAVIRALRNWDIPIKLDRVECLWEPGMELAAEIRRAFGLPGMSPEQTTLFRDKESMKAALDRAGIRTPRHYRARTQRQIMEAAAAIGFPLIVKPIAGAGSANTYRVTNAQELYQVIHLVRQVNEVSVEEFIQGEEFTFDTVTANGRILYHNIAQYFPNMLTARTYESISPRVVALRDLSAPHLQRAYEMGQRVIQALGFQTGFTHMEWFLKPDGELVFGEIGARPPGGRLVEAMCYANDFDVFDTWAEAVIRGRLHHPIQRKYNVAITYKRAKGYGRIRRIDGYREMQHGFGHHIVQEELLPIGAMRRDWKQSILSDGFIILRHPHLATTLKMSQYVCDQLVMHAHP